MLSLRGSTQVYSPTQLCIWVRNADGGIINTMARNPKLALLYRDSKTRSTLIIQGRGHVESDEAVRDRVYMLSPEVEQNHDVAHRGAALIIDVTSVQGTTVRGPVKYSAELGGAVRILLVQRGLIGWRKRRQRAHRGGRLDLLERGNRRRGRRTRGAAGRAQWHLAYEERVDHAQRRDARAGQKDVVQRRGERHRIAPISASYNCAPCGSCTSTARMASAACGFSSACGFWICATARAAATPLAAAAPERAPARSD